MNHPHDFGPWLDLPELEDQERRCKYCPAKEWKNPRLGIYGNNQSQQDCTKRKAA